MISPGYAAQETGFLNRTVEIDGRKYRYQVYVPAEWTSTARWPVILSLHGAGEHGDDGLVQTEVGLGGAIRRHVDRFPAVVVMPQCRNGAWWQDPAMEAQALAALDRTMQEFNGDSDRVYLTGLFDPYAAAAHKIGKIPVWIFHGGADPAYGEPDFPVWLAQRLSARAGSVKTGSK